MSVVASFVDALRSEVAVAELDLWPGIAAAPEAVVHPATTEEVAATMRLATAHGVGVAIVASGDRLQPARRIEGPFLVLRTDRLSGIEIYEPADLTLTAKAGTPVEALAAELHANRQWLPYDPPHVDGYGELRNHVLGLTLVTGDGRTLELGGRVVKNVAGFDLLKPVVGSRGRLGVITSVCVRAFPEPVCERVLVLRADTPAELLPVARSIGTAPVMPASSVVAAELGGERGARLLVRLHGAQATVEADRKTLERHAGVAFQVLSGADADAELSAARDHAATGELVLGLTVLPSRLPDALGALDGLLGSRPFVADTYGGRVRVTAGREDARDIARLRARIEALGGTLSVRAVRAGRGAEGADSGVDPLVEMRALASSIPAAAAALTKGLEEAFDPKGALWPCRP
jgi:glycolate oxidase FAD binding subunit